MTSIWTCATGKEVKGTSEKVDVLTYVKDIERSHVLKLQRF